MNRATTKWKTEITKDKPLSGVELLATWRKGSGCDVIVRDGDRWMFGGEPCQPPTRWAYIFEPEGE